MNTSANRCKSLLDLIFDQLSWGWLFYFCAKSLNEAYQKNGITCARFFFMGAFDSSRNEAILTLSKLLINHPDSISIYTLLSLAQNNPSEFQNADQITVRSSVQLHKEKLDSYASLLRNIKFQRDHVLAHIDKKHINNPSVISSNPPLDMNEVEDCYRGLHQILNDYSLYYDNTEYMLKNIEDEVTDDVDFLVSIINKPIINEAGY